MTSSMVRVASFDIGKKNFCFYVEEFSQDEFKEIKNILSYNERYNEDGTPTEQMQEILNKVFANGKTILYQNTDLTTGSTDNKYIDPIYFYNMTDLLDKFIPVWDTCGAFIIEQQMSFGKRKMNTMALKLGQHCFSYFVINYGRFGKKVLEFPAYHKTNVLGAPKIKCNKKGTRRKYKTMDKPKRKKWSIKQCERILQIRDEEPILTTVGKKRDDLADCVCQLQAFKYLYFINKSITCI